MTPDRELARRLTDHFADEAPRLAPDWILPTALTTIETTKQRRGLLAPWRFTQMPMYAKLGAVGVAVVAIAAVAVWQLNTPGVGHPTSSSSPTPSASATKAATPTQVVAGYVTPPLTQTFTSGIYGLSISYPDGWSAMAGTTPWAPSPGAYVESQGDFLSDPARANLFLKLASQPLGVTPFDQWAAKVLAGRGCTGTSTPVTVDGERGLIDSSCWTALIPSGGRGYLIVAHWDYDLLELRSVDWVGWLHDVLDTVHFQPDAAVDAK